LSIIFPAPLGDDGPRLRLKSPPPILETPKSREKAEHLIERIVPDIREVVADAVHLAEDRGVEAVFAALEVSRDETGRFLVAAGVLDERMLRNRINQQLGRTP
jgi:hypothetical protein